MSDLHVTLGLTQRDVTNADRTREILDADNNAHVVSIALSLTAYVVEQMRTGNEVLFRASDGSLTKLKMKELEPVQRVSETFCERLIRLRVSRGFSQRGLGQRVGLSHAVVSRFESGEYKPRFDSLGPLARALGVTTDYLLTGREPDDALRRAILVRTPYERLVAMARREVV